MTSALAALPPTPRLSRASRCSITELSPTISDQASKFIDGVVSLIWPYSSSTHQAAILVADPDFRVRKAKGQTKVIFHGDSAVAVAESHLGIGDTIHLSLEGALYAQPGDDVSILGKRADWDLEYVAKVFMEVHRGMIPLAVVDVCQSSKSVASPLREIAVNGGYKIRAHGTSNNQELWSSPAFSKQKSRRSDILAGTIEKSVIEEDGYRPGRGRKRTRFSLDSGSWRYVERSPSLDEEKRALKHVSPALNQQEMNSTAVGSPQQGDDDRDVSSADMDASEQHDADKELHDAQPNSREEPDILIASPTLALVERHSEEPPGVVPAMANEKISTADVQDRQQSEQIATSPRVNTPRLLPLALPGLPLVSPLITRDGTAIGEFPPISSTHPEFDSNAEIVSHDLLTEVEPGAASPLADKEVCVRSYGESLSEDAVIATRSHSATPNINPITSTHSNDDLWRGNTIQDLGGEAPASDQYTSRMEESVVLSDEFEFLNDNPVEVQCPGQELPKNIFYPPNETPGEVSPVETLTEATFSSAPPPQIVPSSSHGKEDPRNASDGVAEMAASTSHLMRLSETLVEQPPHNEEIHVPNKIVAVEQKDTKREHSLPVSLASQGTRQWTEALEVSAREVEVHGLSINAPPFPFRQGWDTKAKNQSKVWQLLGTPQTSGHSMPRRTSYDGVGDGGRSTSPELSEAESSLDSGRTSLFYDDDGNLVLQKVEDLEEESKLSDDNSIPETSDERAFTKSEIDDVITPKVVELESDNDATQSGKEPDVIRGMIRRPETVEEGESGASSESDAELASDGLGHQSPQLVDHEDYTQRLPEMPPSRSPSMAPEESMEVFNISSTPVGHALLDSDVHEPPAVLVQEAVAEFTDRPISRQMYQSTFRPDQLATPNHTQEEMRQSKNQDLQDQPQDEEQTVKLPPSPQNTIDVESSQPNNFEDALNADEKQQTMPEDLVPSQAMQRLEETEPVEGLAAPAPAEKDRRRSSRLSGKLPPILKDPSEIISPYFTPKRSNQDSEGNKIPSTPLHQPSSPKIRSRDNVVVLIPPTNGKRSQVDVPEPATSVASTLAKPLPSKRHLRGKGFTTPHSYYPSLSSVPDHFGDQIDILAVAVTIPNQPQRAKSGQKDYHISLKVADSSCDTGDTVSIQLFRPYKNALPACSRGDVLLLRGMKVQTRRTLAMRGKSQGNKELDGMMLLSSESSAWAVFEFPHLDPNLAGEGRPGSMDSSARSQTKRNTPTKLNVQINGPPVELGAEERAFVRGLNKWWIEEGEANFPNVKTSPTQKPKRKSRDAIDELDIPEDMLHEHELRDGMAYGDMISPRPLHEHVHRGGHSVHGDDGRSLHEHELRDGMAYGDTISLESTHEHQHDQSSQDQHLSNPKLPGGHESGCEGEAEEGIEEEQEQDLLHEHELRDGMAYGDTISQRPIHEHLHHDTLNINARDSEAGLAPTEHPNNPINSHSLRNDVSCFATHTNPNATTEAHLDNVATSKTTSTSVPSKTRTRTSTSIETKSNKAAPAHQPEAGSSEEDKEEDEKAAEGSSEDEPNPEPEDAQEEAVHGLRNGTKHILPTSASASTSISAAPGPTGTTSERSKSHRS